ncbi:hypothetical protein BD413DRAFT_200013 [Trametes elegans]|nr:hypothetical protein BD413DRAFT_200013 [Trametes elegans]
MVSILSYLLRPPPWRARSASSASRMCCDARSGRKVSRWPTPSCSCQKSKPPPMRGSRRRPRSLRGVRTTEPGLYGRSRCGVHRRTSSSPSSSSSLTWGSCSPSPIWLSSSPPSSSSSSPSPIWLSCSSSSSSIWLSPSPSTTPFWLEATDAERSRSRSEVGAGTRTRAGTSTYTLFTGLLYFSFPARVLLLLAGAAVPAAQRTWLFLVKARPGEATCTLLASALLLSRALRRGV